MVNIYSLPAVLPDEEQVDKLWEGTDCRIERIISCGQVSPPGFWYEQPEDEWVLLLQGQAVIGYFDGSRSELQTGDYLLIPAGLKHRVEYTSQEPFCIWLAVFGI